MVIQIDSYIMGSLYVSLQIFQQRTLTELWILMLKVKRFSELNVLLHERLFEFAQRNSPQVIQTPHHVKFLKGESLQSCFLDSTSIKSYTASHLVWLEHMLRTTGYEDNEKTFVANIIQSYALTGFEKKYYILRNKLWDKLGLLPDKPKGFPSDYERVLDKELNKKLQEQEEKELIKKLQEQEDEIEAGEIRE